MEEIEITKAQYWYIHRGVVTFIICFLESKKQMHDNNKGPSRSLGLFTYPNAKMFL